jgi:uncharacterized protein
VSDVDARPYREALERGELVIQRCEACGTLQFPPRVICVACGGTPGWTAVGGRGRVYAATICHRPGAPWLADDVPYMVALVDLDEGVRLLARMHCECSELEVIGRPVRAVVARDARGEPTVGFELEDAAG